MGRTGQISVREPHFVRNSLILRVCSNLGVFRTRNAYFRPGFSLFRPVHRTVRRQELWIIGFE